MPRQTRSEDAKDDDLEANGVCVLSSCVRSYRLDQLMNQINNDLMLFDEAMPLGDLVSEAGFKSQCPPDKKIKVENLFKFRRKRADLQVSIAALLISLFFLASFWTQTGWQDRKLPNEMGAYIGHQLGIVEIEGRVTRLGRILKQAWVVPLLCLLFLVPAALLNFFESYKVWRWRQRFRQPTDANFELVKYAEALEYVLYFIAYSLCVPYLGYLVSTLILGMFLTWRLGYRTRLWILKGFIASFLTVVVFRTLLQIKTPIDIWLYNQFPETIRAFMLTYF